MQKNELLQNGNAIIRVLDVHETKALIIPCTRKSMPKWIDTAEITYYKICSEEYLLSKTGVVLTDIESLDSERKRFAHEHYTLIASILPFIGDEKHRSYVISKVSSERQVSKQTIRNYLCLYLVYQNIAALAPKPKTSERPLTPDEKNIRWAINKFYYTQEKNSLNTAYTLMLKARYCTPDGTLLSEYPSFHQFKYFYKKHKNQQTYYISRNGLKNYQRNNRPLLGDGVQSFAPNIGIAMLDSTICDIYLVNDSGSIVGRPILTACVDAYSGLCCGYSLSWEGGVYSLRSLLANVITDKVEWCKQFGISIESEDWNCSQLPATLITDMGSEYKSVNFEQIAELGVTVVNLPPYRPELKGIVEKFFDLVQSYFKKHLKGRGVIEPDYQERGSHDYRKDACLTMRDFERIVLHCIIFYNSKRIIENFPYTPEMLTSQIQPHASNIWNYGMSNAGANLIKVDYSRLILSLLPRTTGKFSRKGLTVNKLRYKHENYTERYLNGGSVTVAYNPDDVSMIWLIENGTYIRFNLIEERYKGMDLSQVDTLKSEQKRIIKSATDTNRQAQIDLAEHIETIANASSRPNTSTLTGIRTTRKQEQNKTHINFMNGGVSNE